MKRTNATKLQRARRGITAGAGGSTAWKINTKGIARSASTKTALLHLLQRRSDADQERNYGHALSGVTAGASKKTMPPLGKTGSECEPLHTVVDT
jgi:hypothetical protein